MSVFVEWQNGNEGRNYPLHDSASRIASNGLELPNNLVTDLSLWFPSAAGRSVCLSSVGVTPKLISLALAAVRSRPFQLEDSSAGPEEWTPLGVIQATRLVEVGRLYRIDPFFDGVAGWASFGSGVDTIENSSFWNFLDPAASILLPRCYRAYSGTRLDFLGKVGSSSRLQGLVKLTGSSGQLRTYKARRKIWINGVEVEKDVGVIALDLSENKVTKLQEFAGPCRGRPSAHTCQLSPIERIGTVTPDVNGNINLIVDCSTAVGDVGTGLILDFALGLDALCPVGFAGTQGIPPGPPTPPSPSGSSDSSTTPVDPDPEPHVGPEYCEDFEAPPAELSVITGNFVREQISSEPVNTRFVSAAGDLGPQTTIDQFRQLNAELEPYLVKATIRPRTSDGNGFLIAGYKNEQSFVFAGLTLKNGGMFFLGRKLVDGYAWPAGLGSGYVFLAPVVRNYFMPLTDYRVFWLLKDPTVCAVRFVWNDGTTERMQQFGFPWAPGTFNALGFTGLGSVGSETEFDDFGVNCGGSSSAGLGV